jgi:hypothetical protein
MTLSEVCKALGVAWKHPDDCWCPSCWDDIKRTETPYPENDVLMECLGKLPRNYAVWSYGGGGCVAEISEPDNSSHLCVCTGPYAECVIALATRYLESR